MKPVPLVAQGPMYPEAVVRRALELVREHGAIYRAHNALKAEMAAAGLEAPVWSTMWEWAKGAEDVIARLDGNEKRDWMRLSSEVMTASGQKMLSAIEDDEKVTHAQRAMDYGIATDKVVALVNAGSKAPQMAVQFNFTKREDA